MASRQWGGRHAQELRAKVLRRDQGYCYLCGLPGADTVDHIEPRARGGTDALTNLAAAHAHCNGVKGDKDLSAIDAPNISDGRPLVSKTAGHPAAPLPVRVSQNQRQADLDGIRQKRPKYGAKLPRLSSVSWVEKPKQSHRRALNLAKQLGVELYPWQKQVLRRLYERDRDSGLYLHRRGLVSCARQQGKTFLMALVLTDRILHDDPKGDGTWQGILMAQMLHLATDVWRIVCENVRTLAPERISAVIHGGAPYLRLDDHTRELRPQSANDRAGHGMSADLVLIDELQAKELTAAVVEHGLAPTQRARPDPQMLAISTAGTEASEVMRTWRQRGITELGQPSRFLFMEWSATPDAAVGDDQAVAAANPALGYGLTWDAIDEERRTAPRAAFQRAVLNQWTQAERPWMDQGLWEKRRSDVRVVPLVAAVEQAPDADRWCIVLAGASDEVPVCLSAEVHDDEADLWDRVEGLMAAEVDVRIGASMEHRWPWDMDQMPPDLVGMRELKAWSAHVRKLVRTGVVVHDGNEQLAEHVARAQADTIRSEGVEFPSTAASSGPIWLCRAMVWAVALLSAPEQAKPAPVLHVAR